VYLSLRCFPTYIYSSLKHIQHLVLFPARDRANLDRVVDMLVPHLTRLSKEGISIHGKLFKFQFLGFIGDNLGLHQVLGLSESFSANYFCRFCRTHKATTKKMTQENSSVMRNFSNYNVDIATNNPSLTGIKRYSPLNSIPNYHVTKNYFVDIMHDCLEGSANFGMCCIIHHYMNVGVFSVEQLNQRLNNFPMQHMSNRPPPIKMSYLEKGCLPYSAAEMKNLTIFLSYHRRLY